MRKRQRSETAKPRVRNSPIIKKPWVALPLYLLIDLKKKQQAITHLCFCCVTSLAPSRERRWGGSRHSRRKGRGGARWRSEPFVTWQGWLASWWVGRGRRGARACACGRVGCGPGPCARGAAAAGAGGSRGRGRGVCCARPRRFARACCLCSRRICLVCRSVCLGRRRDQG